MIARVFFLVSALFSFSAAGADLVPFDIGGMKIGDKLTEEFAYSHCPAKDKGNAERTCHKSIEIEGADVFVMYYFDELKLISVSLSYKSSIFEDVVGVYTSKFGQPPHQEKKETVTTKAGVEYTNIIKSWNTISGEFIIEKYGSGIDKGRAYLLSSEFEKYLIKKKNERQQELGGKL